MFSKELNKKLDKYHLLNHYFYKAWNEGKLNREIIKDYAEQYYQHVKAFPRYISAAHSMCEDLDKRKILLENLQDEEKEGADCWFNDNPQKFLGRKYKKEDYIQSTDICEVWFDSGSTHSFVLEKRKDLTWPASMYLEGSDQHRGWFHSSLLESCGTRGRAPFNSILSHGFVVDGKGLKMSKSTGNIIAPEDIL